MHRSLFASAALMTAFLAGCGATGYPTHVNRTDGFSGPLEVSYRIDLSFASNLPDSYLQRSGPLEVYKTYNVNKRFHARLSEYVREKSGGSSDEQVDLLVTVEELTTQYDQIGVEERDRRSFGRFEAFAFPKEIIKTASLTLTAVVQMKGATVREETVSVESRDVFRRDFDYDRRAWAYDYTEVFERVFSQGIEKIDRMIDGLRQEKPLVTGALSPIRQLTGPSPARSGLPPQ